MVLDVSSVPDSSSSSSSEEDSDNEELTMDIHAGRTQREKKGLGKLHISHLLQMVLQDAQTRLFFKAQAVIQSEIRYYVPKGDDLAYPDKLVGTSGYPIRSRRLILLTEGFFFGQLQGRCQLAMRSRRKRVSASCSSYHHWTKRIRGTLLCGKQFGCFLNYMTSSRSVQLRSSTLHKIDALCNPARDIRRHRPRGGVALSTVFGLCVRSYQAPQLREHLGCTTLPRSTFVNLKRDDP
jgi:hypothetical protein